jgi:hypothetical protein
MCDIIPYVDLLDVVRIEPFYTVRTSRRTRSDSYEWNSGGRPCPLLRSLGQLESIAVLLFLTVAVIVPSIFRIRSKDCSSRLDGLVVRPRVSEHVEKILACVCIVIVDRLLLLRMLRTHMTFGFKMKRMRHKKMQAIKMSRCKST